MNSAGCFSCSWRRRVDPRLTISDSGRGHLSIAIRHRFLLQPDYRTPVKLELMLTATDKRGSEGPGCLTTGTLSARRRTCSIPRARINQD